MRAMLINDKKDFVWSKVSDPKRKENEVIIEVHAAALNRADLMQRAGEYPSPPEWPEWGNPITRRADYRLIASYSPIDNVRRQPYPPILALAGLADPRVTYWEPAKWVAKLRATKTNDDLLVLRTNMDAGHGGASGRFDRLHETALATAFALKVTGKT